MKKYLALLPLLLICTYANAQTWQQVPLRTAVQKNAGFFGGEGFQAIQDVEYAPSNANVLYMVIDTAGMWKSNDGGTTWQRANNGFGANGGPSLGIHPTDHNKVFVAGSHMHEGVSGSVMGIFRTTDGGNNWSLVKTTTYVRDSSCRGASFFAFSGANTVYAGTQGEGLLKSTDGGTTWNTIVSSPSYITDIEIHPTDSTTLYMCTTSGLYRVVDSGSVTTTKIGLALPNNPLQMAINKNSPTTMYVTLGAYGVYRSTDGGTNFSARNNGMTATTNAGYRARNIEISPADPDYLYVGYNRGSNVSPYGYFYTHDGGANWSVPIEMDLNNYMGSLDSWYGMVIGNAYGVTTATHPTDKNIAITITSGEHLRKTVDGGMYWVWSGDKYTGGALGGSGCITPVGWDTGNPNKYIFFLTDFGPFLTTDDGDTFAKRQAKGTLGFGSTRAGTLVSNSDIVIAASGHWSMQRLMVSRDLGTSWTEISNTDANYSFITPHPTNTNIVYAGKYKFTSIQTNNNYTTLSRTVMGMYRGNGDIVYSVDSSGGVTTVYKSTNGGSSWTSPYPTIPASGQVGQIAIAPNDENRIYIAMKATTPNDKAGIWIINNTSANGGTATLKDSSNGLSKDQFNEMNYYSVVVDPRNPNVLYAGQYSSYKGTSNGIFRSLDYGNTWNNISGNLTTWFTTNCLVVNPNNSYVYVGSFYGTWKLPPPGEEPPPPSGGMPSITTGTTTNIAQTTATFGAMVNSNNSTSTVSWKYGTQSGSYTLFTGSQTVNASTSSVPVTFDVTGLTNNTNYYLVARASNAYGSVVGSETSFSTTQRKNINVPAGTPIVDGNLTEYTLTTTINNYNIEGTPVAVGTAGVLWSPNYIYVAAQITDGTLSASGTDTAVWMYDGLEIYFDSDYNFVFDSYTKQFGVSYLGKKVNSSAGGTSTGMLVGTATVSGGYKIEVGIPTSLLGLGTLTATQQIGFDLQLNDNNSPIKTSRDGAYSWNNNENTNYYTANKYGKITLIGAGGVGDSALTIISDFALKAMFNEGTGTFLRDSSGNNRHGTITQGASWNSGIGANGALLFDGINDYCTFPEMEYTGTSSISVFALVKPITIKPTHNPSIVSKRSSYSNITFQLGFRAGVDLDWMWSDTSGETQFYVGGTPEIGTNSTKCIGAVFNYSSPSSVDYYMGGTKTAKLRFSGTGTSPKDTNVPILVGIAYSSASIGNLPNAVIDNVYILNRAATTQEIIDISTLPLVLTGTATNITSTTATLSGTVTANGSSNTNGYFQYGLVPGIYTGTSSEKSIGTGTTPIGFTKVVSGLPGSTTIYYRAVGYNAANIVYGTETSFNTSSNDITAPVGTVSVNSGATYTLSTGVTLTLTATDAVGVSGYFVSENDTTPYATQTGWFDIGTTTSYSDSKPFSVSNGDGTKTVNVWYKDGSGNISSKAQDSIVLDTVFASIVIGTPTASCNLYTDGSKVYGTSGTSINLSGIAYDINGVQKIEVSNSGTTTVLTATGTDTWSKTITIVGASGNLISATGYDVPENQGTDTIRIGNYPVPVTGTATNIGTVTVTLNGNLIANLGNTCTAFFEYSTTSDSYVGSSSTYVVNAPGTTTEKPVSISLSGLIPATEYFYRLAASNDIGTTVSYESSFTTDELPNDWSVVTGGRWVYYSQFHKTDFLVFLKSVNRYHSFRKHIRSSKDWVELMANPDSKLSSLPID